MQAENCDWHYRTKNFRQGELKVLVNAFNLLFLTSSKRAHREAEQKTPRGLPAVPPQKKTLSPSAPALYLQLLLTYFTSENASLKMKC